MKNIMTEIHEAHDLWVTMCGVSPNEIYLGKREYDEFRDEIKTHYIKRGPVRIGDQKTEYKLNGWDVFEVTEPSHIGFGIALVNENET